MDVVMGRVAAHREFAGGDEDHFVGIVTDTCLVVIHGDAHPGTVAENIRFQILLRHLFTHLADRHHPAL